MYIVHGGRQAINQSLTRAAAATVQVCARGDAFFFTTISIMKYTHRHLGNQVRASTETTTRRKKTARKSFYEYVKTFILQSI